MLNLIKTENNILLRDPNSKALIVSDDLSRIEFKKKQVKDRLLQENIQNLSSEIDELKQTISEINIIKNEIQELKQLILSQYKAN